MKKRLFLFLFIGIIIFFTKRQYISTLTSVKNETKLPSFYLINVLNKTEFDDAHIPGSINVPFSSVSKFLNNIEDKSIPLIFYCSNYFCTASDASAKTAIKKGFKNVYVYKGGMAEWYQAGQEDHQFIYNGDAKAEYLRVIILPEEVLLDESEDIIDENTPNTENFKIISINNLQIFLKEGKLIV